MNTKNLKPSPGFKLVSVFLWLLFVVSIGMIAFYNAQVAGWNWRHIFRINSLTVVIWATVTFFSAVVSTFASKYLIGFRYQNRFIAFSLGFTFSVLFLVFSDHIAPLLISWFGMGFFMAKLIGVKANWGEAQKASAYCMRNFFIGGVFLSAGVVTLSYYTDEFTLSGLTAAFGDVPYYILLLSALCIIVAAMIQSAMFPFHRWLLSAMTSPTPASALMHAGFVNGAGILLTLLAPLFFESGTMNILFIIGGVTAIAAQFAKLIQVNVKQKLACSTMAQMAFMIMQCGLGFFNAAVVHLILHGFYKAYLFLSSGEEVKHVNPKGLQRHNIKPGQAIFVLVFGILGALFFGWITGKGFALDSGIFLTLIVAITVGQATHNIVKQHNLPMVQKAVVMPVLFFVSIGLYALLYNGVTGLISEMPMVDHPESLSVVQIVFGVIFLIGFFIMKLGFYQKIPWLYVKLMNDTQPAKKTVLRYKNNFK